MALEMLFYRSLLSMFLSFGGSKPVAPIGEAGVLSPGKTRKIKEIWGKSMKNLKNSSALRKYFLIFLNRLAKFPQKLKRIFQNQKQEFSIENLSTVLFLHNFKRRITKLSISDLNHKKQFLMELVTENKVESTAITLPPLIL